jgi:acetyl esterase/lipase
MLRAQKLLYFFLFFIWAMMVQGAERPGRKWSTVERLERKRLQAVHDARMEWKKARVERPGTGIYEDYRAVLHVHAEDSKHTGGTRTKVLEGARLVGVQIVMLTDHRGPKTDTWRGLREGVLFFAGSEENDRLRFPLFSGEAIAREDLQFICHIEERYDISANGFDGMEIYNRHTDTKDDEDFEAWFLALLKDKERWAEFEQLYREFPDEIFGAGTDYWPEIFARWDKETQLRPFTGIGANDAHENQVFNGLMLDPYAVSFRNLSTHILARELTESAIRQSLREGHVYVSHDWLCDPKGFSFVAANNLGVFTMGDPATRVGTTRLIAQTPVAAKIKLFRNGELQEEKSGDRVTFETKTAGTYRVEAWLSVDDEDRPWIYSNPVYLKEVDLSSVQLPSLIKPDNVEIKKDVAYVEDGDSKHKLDLYLPKYQTNFPVFLFIHGGSWSSGDRSQYPPLGNRYAAAGIGTAVMSYRLAPANRHPAQIEDAAAAFAWVLKNIGRHGGDTNRIFVGGHSAGGHLAALLGTDRKYLERHGLTSKNIKGIISLSGAFDVSDGKEKVFGPDAAQRKEASPLFHIRDGLPPFLLTYCEWDYFPLALQAKAFHAALERNGTLAEIVFVTKESHISEMLSVSKPDDQTVAAVLGFIRAR